MTRSALRALLFFGVLLATLGAVTPAEAGEHRFGLGAHFWRTVDEITDDNFSGFDDIEDDGFAWVASYQYVPRSLLKFELDLEYYNDGFGGSTDSALTPIAYVLVGSRIYGALGVGVTFSSGLADDVSDPFFAARVGYQLTVVPGIILDINANYRAGAFNDLDEADTDAMTLGAIIRFDF